MGHEEMAALVAGMGNQLRWARNLTIQQISPVRHVVLCGMGGSGISGDFATVLASAPLQVHKGYELPEWVGDVEPLILAVSYSGDTEEVLSGARAAIELGLPIAWVSSGGELAALGRTNDWPGVMLPEGLPPRASLGYLLGAVVRLLGAGGAVPDPLGALDEAATVVDELTRPGSAAHALAEDLAEGLDGRLVVVYGSQGLTAPVAQRFKTQLNENAKWPAWWGVIPELDHNEITGWASLREVTVRRVGILAVRDRGESLAVAARFRHTQSVTEESVPWVGEVWSYGESKLARMMSLVTVGDLLSLEMARLAGADPTQVPAIEELKTRLKEESR
jgi:glucose/mannose-6-phosphate isomerase